MLHTHPAHSEMQMGSLCAFIFFQQALFVHGKPIFSARQVTKNAKKSVWELNLRLLLSAVRHIPLDRCCALPLLQSGTVYRLRDENFFFRKLRDILGFHMTPTTEQP